MALKPISHSFPGEAYISLAMRKTATPDLIKLLLFDFFENLKSDIDVSINVNVSFDVLATEEKITKEYSVKQNLIF